ncbi:MAG: nicotinate-nucleotide adenylyltransferase [Hyphomicrobiaceae bacterium]|nr:nicotinate-nucleotide adenylyltransferase [Hyphomicrobiaceae bacterium]
MLAKPPHAAPGLRIGLMGGSFNPPHDGHLHVAREVLRRVRLDAVWWIVSPGNPLKAGHATPPLAARIAQARALAASEPRIAVTGFEAELGSVFTVDTLAFLRRRYPLTRFVWVMGADNLAGFHRWRRWRGIAPIFPIAVVDRPGWHLAALSSPAASALARNRIPEANAATLPTSKPPAWAFLTGRLSPLSSTELRREIQEMAGP